MSKQYALSTIVSQEVPGFLVVLRQAAESPELLEEYDRLYGSNLRARGALVDIIAIAIAEAGTIDQEADAFVAFVRDHVWQRIAPDAREAVCDRAIASMAA